MGREPWAVRRDQSHPRPTAQRSTAHENYRAQGNAEKLLTLDVDEFLRRFLLHVLPPRLVRIRYYGFLANCTRAHHIELARQLIGGRFLPPVSPLPTDDHCCPHCGTGTLRVVGPVPAERPPPLREDLL